MPRRSCADRTRTDGSFFHLALSDGFVFWNEKDPDYRETLMRGLSIVDVNA